MHLHPLPASAQSKKRPNLKRQDRLLLEVLHHLLPNFTLSSPHLQRQYSAPSHPLLFLHYLQCLTLVPSMALEKYREHIAKNWRVSYSLRLLHRHHHLLRQQVLEIASAQEDTLLSLPLLRLSFLSTQRTNCDTIIQAILPLLRPRLALLQSRHHQLHQWAMHLYQAYHS